jgi:ketosteroid isomerase-like protein
MVRGDIDQLVGMISTDCRLWVSGDLANSGAFEGEAVARQFRRTSGSHDRLFKSVLRLDIGMITAEEDRVCVEAASDAELVEGGTYQNAFHFIFVIRDDKVIEFKEYMDTKHVFDRIASTRSVAGMRAPNLTSVSSSIASE